LSTKKTPKQLDRRIIFLILLVGVIIPLMVPLGFKSEESDLVRQVHKLVEDTPEGSVVLLSFDYDPSTATELQPMVKAVIEHAWRRNQKIVAVALWPQGSQMAEQAFNDILIKFPTKKYGMDYVNVGFKTGGMVTIQSMGRSFKDVFPADLQGTAYDQIPLFNGIRNFNQIAYVMSFSAGDPGLKQYVMAAHDIYGVKVSGGVTAVSTPGFLPYVNDQHQLYGLMGGLKGAAEYEALIEVKGTATAGMDAQSIAHILVIVFIIMGNLRAWRVRKNTA
jgi:hypothetical protein